jgi:hypothetical protein
MPVQVVALTLLVASCGGAASGGTTDATESSTTTVVVTTIPQATTVPPTTTTSSTTTTTRAPTPQELRTGFLTALEDAGWKTHKDELVGWSAKYPGDWDVIADDSGGQFVLVPPAEGGAIVIMTLLDASDNDASSDDYLRRTVVSSVEQGLLREPQDDAWFWLDTDFNGVQGPQDIVGIELSFAIDPTIGGTLTDEQFAPFWHYGYHDPSLRPAFGYLLQTFGVSPVVFENADGIFTSFEPPGGYPSLQASAG